MLDRDIQGLVYPLADALKLDLMVETSANGEYNIVTAQAKHLYHPSDDLSVKFPCTIEAGVILPDLKEAMVLVNISGELTMLVGYELKSDVVTAVVVHDQGICDLKDEMMEDWEMALTVLHPTVRSIGTRKRIETKWNVVSEQGAIDDYYMERGLGWVVEADSGHPVGAGPDSASFAGDVPF